jgi:hypothetical protein
MKVEKKGKLIVPLKIMFVFSLISSNSSPFFKKIFTARWSR